MAGQQAQVQFGLSRFQLVELMATDEKERINKIEEYEGIETIAGHLHTSIKAGVSDGVKELEARKLEYGVNYIVPVPPKSFVALMFDAIQDKTLIILIVAALLSMVLGLTVEEEKNIAWIEGAAILVAVFIVVVVTAINDWTKERQFRGLQEKLETDARFSVLREGELLELPLAELVVGDVAQFKYGNTFPVDGILLEGFDVKVDESTLTGEAALRKKRVNTDPMLYAGTKVMEGGGKMLVMAVGPNSKQGKIFTLMQQRDEEAGFITEWFRKMRDRVMGRRREEDAERGEEQNENRKDVDVQVREFDPDKPLAEANSDEEEEEEVLTECARWNLIQRVKKQRVKKKKSKEEEEKEKEKKEDKSEQSGSLLQKKLNKLAIQIGYAGTAAAILCVLILTLKYSIEEFAIDQRGWDSSTDFSQLLHFVIIGITVLVVAVPEGLPLAVTIALAFSVKKMLKDNNLVRHLHACETMGNATSICSDKTGTLTTNRMTVVESYFAGTRYDVTPDPADLPQELLEVLKLNIAVNSSYTSKLLTEEEEEDEGKMSWMERVKACMPWSTKSTEGLLGQGLAKQVGNVTECALLGFLVELGIDYEAIREAYPTSNLTKVFTFNSSRKSMTTVFSLPGGGYRMLTKGASEVVIGKCSSVMVENGRVQPLSEDDRKELVATVVQSMASNALRTICLAYKDFPPAGDGITVDPDWEDEESVISDLTCLGVVGIQDPVRPEVPGCIEKCKASGITVRMVTGDNVDTARAIAEKCGIIAKGDGYFVIDGKEFNRRIRDSNGEVSQEKMDRLWPWLRVLARSSPEDKHTLVEGIILSRLRKSREVVAVTGDGTNDGPALKRADVGFAMGIAGTDVAKEACDIILTDDNFASIVKAVQWGRNVYDSISKFLQFQLTVNIVAVSIALISAISIGDSPLRAVQMLWVNLIMDTFASLALATEAPTEELLKRKPYGRTRSLISRQMWLFLGGHSLYQLGVMLILVFAGSQLFDIDNGGGRDLRAPPTEHFTIVFNTFVFFQIFNEINARKIHGERNVFTGIHRNYIFLAVIVGQTIVQVLIVEFGDIVFSTSGLTLDLWLWCIFLGSTELVVGQLLLLIPLDKIPKFRKAGKDEPDFELPVDPLEEKNRARYLWVKSLTRVRTQIRVVNAFRLGLESGSNIHLSRLPHYASTPRSQRYSPVTGKETAV